MQNALSGSLRNIDKKLNRLSGTVLTDRLGVFLHVDQRLASWLTKNETELCLNCDICTCKCHIRSQQSHQHANQAKHQSSVVFLQPLAFSSNAEHYSSSLSSHTTLPAAAIDAELHTEQQSPIFCPKSAKKDVIFSISNEPVFLKIV